MSFTIQRVLDSVALGEGPHWDAETQTLYFVDVLSCSIHRYKPSTNEHTKVTLEESVSFIIPVKGAKDKFVLALLKDIVIVTWDEIDNKISKLEKVGKIEGVNDSRDHRFNDGKVDFVGKLWTGTVIQCTNLTDGFPPIGAIISVNKEGQLKYQVDGIQISNGFAFNEDLKKLYYIDSMKRTIDEFDYNVEDESISNRKSIFSLDKHGIEGLADGQTIDTDGNLWIAIFNGSKVIKINPRVPESLLQTIDMPAKQVTSVAFGGTNLDELYVTTAKCAFGGDHTPTEADGATYKITGLGVKGYAGKAFQYKNN